MFPGGINPFRLLTLERLLPSRVAEIVRIWWSADVVELTIFDQRKTARRMYAARASYSWLANRYPNLPNDTFDPGGGSLWPAYLVGPSATAIAVGLGSLILFPGLWTFLAFMAAFPFAIWVMPRSYTLSLAMTRKRVALIRITEEDEIEPLDTHRLLKEYAPNPYSIGDYSNSETDKDYMLDGLERERSKLAVAALIMGALGGLALLWFFVIGNEPVPADPPATQVAAEESVTEAVPTVEGAFYDAGT